MDKREAVKIAEKYVGTVNQKYPIEKAILFGSYAKGTEHTDSDIDLALVFDSVDDIIDRQIELMKLFSVTQIDSAAKIAEALGVNNKIMYLPVGEGNGFMSSFLPKFQALIESGLPADIIEKLQGKPQKKK